MSVSHESLESAIRASWSAETTSSPDESIIDISRDQYPAGQIFEPAPVDGDVREYVLANEQTRQRYQELALRVGTLMKLTEDSYE